jgi:hypothetical protein
LIFPDPGAASTTAVNPSAPNAAAAVKGNSQVAFIECPSVEDPAAGGDVSDFAERLAELSYSVVTARIKRKLCNTK